MSMLDGVNILTLLMLAAVVGMIVFASAKRKGKTAEATRELTEIAQRAARAYDESEATRKDLRTFPPSSRRSVPTSVDLVRGKRFKSAEADWDVAPWKDLVDHEGRGFSISEPQNYAYSFESQGVGAKAHATALARGDLDGDGRESTFSISIAADDQTYTAKPGTIVKKDPEE